MIINVNSQLYCGVNSQIELPINNWSEVKSWYVKWDRLHYTLDGEKWEEVILESGSVGRIDWKRPISVEIMDEEMQTTLDDSDW